MLKPWATQPRFGPDVADMEFGVPLASLPAGLSVLESLPEGEIGWSSLPGGDVATIVHRGAYPTLGGVPAVDPTDFSPVQPVSSALNDLSCRFHVYRETDFACTQDSSGNLVFSNSGSTLQFCTLVNGALTFPNGVTVLSARLRDTEGNTGPVVQIVVRITPR